VKHIVRTVLGCMIAFGLTSRSQTVGAFSWAAITVGFDFYWQWFRWRRIQSAKPMMVWMGVSGGFVIRVLSIVTAVWLARLWLHPKVFRIYVMTLLALPIWNIIAAFIFWKGK